MKKGETMLQKLFIRLLGLFGSYLSNSYENDNSIRGILSFFPSHWTEELVAEKVYESLQNLIQMPELMPCGHYKLLGITKDNRIRWLLYKRLFAFCSQYVWQIFSARRV